jgi:hypothetical protein
MVRAGRNKIESAAGAPQIAGFQSAKNSVIGESVFKAERKRGRLPDISTEDGNEALDLFALADERYARPYGYRGRLYGSAEPYDYADPEEWGREMIRRQNAASESSSSIVNYDDPPSLEVETTAQVG